MPRKIKYEEILEKVYSVDNFNYDEVKHFGEAKECPLCHKQFYGLGRNWYFQKFCNRTHYVDCFVCGQPVKQEHPSTAAWSIKPACKGECSRKFKSLQTQGAIFEKYGVINVSQSEQFRDKISAGIKAKSEQITKHRMETCLE